MWGGDPIPTRKTDQNERKERKMKKILTASLVAMMAVSAAHADIASTKYVVGKIGDEIDNLDVTEQRVEGSYVAFVNETDGKVASQKVAFDTTVSEKSTDGNAPTSKAVYTAITNKEDVANKLEEKPEDWEDKSPEEQAKYYASVNYVDAEVSAVAGAAAGLSSAVSTLTSTVNSNKTAAEIGINEAKAAAAAAQDKSDADYQIGSNAGWINLIDTLPTKCKEENAECAMVARDGKLAWELISGSTAVEGKIPPVTPAVAE